MINWSQRTARQAVGGESTPDRAPKSSCDLSLHSNSLTILRGAGSGDVPQMCDGGPKRDLGPVQSRSQALLPDCARRVEAVKGAIASRRKRSRFFSAALFADPAWDILLELYLGELEQRRIAVSNLCLAAKVPTSTAMRWIAALVDRGIILRRPDQLDRRRVYVELTQETSDAMRAYFGVTDGLSDPPQY